MENTDSVEPKTQHTEETHTIKVEEPVVKQTVTSAAEPKSSNKGVMAIISLVLGIIGLCAWFIPICGGPLAITGLVLGIIGIKSDKKTMSIIGLILNILALIAAIINAILGAIIGISQYNDIMKTTDFDFAPTEIESPSDNDTDTNTDITNNQNDLTLIEVKPYVNSEKGFSINPPKNWTEEDGSSYGSIVTFMSDKVNEDSVFAPNINVVSESAQGYSLDEYVDASIEGLTSYLEKYELIDQKKLDINGTDAVILSGKFTQENFDIQNMQLIYIKNDTAYIITATVLESEWNSNYEDIFNASFSSFTVN
ncbi:hypothetical protein KBD45_08390 [Candidatus Dojkabacteria bacterium]|nr:hypothetical protein [Candidatus Dojkabacteria bacterium]